MEKIPFTEALSYVKAVKPRYSKQIVHLPNSVNQILAEPVYANYSVPPSPVSAMDGFAVSAEKTKSASKSSPVTLTQKDFDRVNTGNIVRPEFDSVIMVEDVEFDGSDNPTEIRISSPIKAGKNVRATGEDIVAGRLVLPAGAKIRPFDIGALAGYGITEVSIKSVSVGIIPTGSELIQPGTIPKNGEVVESNSIMTEAYLQEFGVSVTRYAPVPDNLQLIRGAIERAVSENDIVLISAGSSMGSKDFTARAIAELGEVIFHGVFMKPAKPSMLGIVNGKPVIGMPGFPLAAQTTLRLFVRELLDGWGWKGPEQENITAEAGEIVESDENIDEFRFASAADVGGRIVVLPQIRSASMQMNGIRANCYIHIPRGIEEVNAGESVTTVLNVPLAELKQTILLGGIYSTGSEAIAIRAAASGAVIRFGDISSTNLSLLENKACHGMCVKEDTDLSSLTFEVETFDLKDGTILVMRKDMTDSLCAALRSFAEVN